MAAGQNHGTRALEPALATRVGGGFIFTFIDSVLKVLIIYVALESLETRTQEPKLVTVSLGQVEAVYTIFGVLRWEQKAKLQNSRRA